jgi:hypothetical protein
MKVTALLALALATLTIASPAAEPELVKRKYIEADPTLKPTR